LDSLGPWVVFWAWVFVLRETLSNLLLVLMDGKLLLKFLDFTLPSSSIWVFFFFKITYKNPPPPNMVVEDVDCSWVKSELDFVIVANFRISCDGFWAVATWS
jgi:hypothetical protein